MELSGLAEVIQNLKPEIPWGRVSKVQGLLIDIKGVQNFAAIGNNCVLHTHEGKRFAAEIVGLSEDTVQAMVFEDAWGIKVGNRVDITADKFRVYPHEKWLGRIIDGFGQAIDDRGQLMPGGTGCFVYGSPPVSFQRERVGKRIETGVKALDVFTTCCRGQRMGIFAGTGVGKSVLLGQIAKYSQADVNVIGLIGERGREVREFVEQNLGEEGLKKSIVVVATSDESPLKRKQAAYLTLTLAEYFRDQGKSVFCFLDSVTRFAMALREISLSTGELPATKGYTPSVFAALPRLLERAGPGNKGSSGSVTGLFTVLVDGDDLQDPIADTVRGILDGHLVLSRQIAERHRFPAIDVLKSLSRMTPECYEDDERVAVQKARELMTVYEDMADMIRLGAYRQGRDKKVDEAIQYHDPLESFLRQNKTEKVSLDQGFRDLKALLNHE